MLADARLELEGLTGEKINTLNYKSDHKALTLSIKLDSINAELTPPINTHAKNYRKTNWNKFRKFMEKQKDLTISQDRNLINEEIEIALREIETNIDEAIQKIIPDHKKVDLSDKYLNPRIEHLHKKKSKQMTALNNVKMRYNPNLQSTKAIIRSVNSDINKTKYEIRKEFSKSVNSYWADKARKINHRDSENFFPNINHMFRSQTPNIIETITISTEDTDTINRINLNTSKAIVKENKYVLTDTIQILNINGTSYEKQYSTKQTDSNNRLYE